MTLYKILSDARARRDGCAATWQDIISCELTESGAIAMIVPPNSSPTEVQEAYRQARDHHYPNRRSKPINDKWRAFFSYAIAAGVDPDNLAGSCDTSRLVEAFNKNKTVQKEEWIITPHERRRITDTWRKIVQSIDKFLLPTGSPNSIS